MEYLDFMKDPKSYGTEYDIIMLCEFLQVSIKLFPLSRFLRRADFAIVKHLLFMEINHKIPFCYGL
jgi:hypothetical protein